MHGASTPSLAPAPPQVLAYSQSRGYAAKDILFGDSCRASMLQGVEKLADAVQVTLGPKVGLCCGGVAG